jgi:hypothetical protein
MYQHHNFFPSSCVCSVFQVIFFLCFLHKFFWYHSRCFCFHWIMRVECSRMIEEASGIKKNWWCIHQTKSSKKKNSKKKVGIIKIITRNVYNNNSILVYTFIYIYTQQEPEPVFVVSIRAVYKLYSKSEKNEKIII